MKNISTVSEIIDRYDALLLDVWGVVHDGTRLYPGVHETLEKLKESRKKIMFVSNAPRRAAKVSAVLAQLGIEPALYEEAISSGEMGYRWLKDGRSSWGKRYYYIGPSKDADVLDGLDYSRSDDIKQADFLLNVGFGSEEQSAQDWMPRLRAAKGCGLPMLCLNPDREVVKQTGERYPCAGVIAEAYEKLGGTVTWFGKPYREIYDYCLAKLAPVARSRILAVGDSITTDIAGAARAGIDTLLVKGGILKEMSQPEIGALCEKESVSPVYAMERFIY